MSLQCLWQIICCEADPKKAAIFSEPQNSSKPPKNIISLSRYISFDAYSFFDKFVLYPDEIRKFMARGGILAWGIVPTLHVEDLEKETTESLLALWEEMINRIESLGIDRSVITAQSLITPSCGTGSLSRDQAEKVLQVTREVSQTIRQRK